MAKKGGVSDYASFVFTIYEKVVQVGLPNFIGACIQVPTNFNITAWEKLAATPEAHRVVDFLTFGFSAGYEGSVPCPFALPPKIMPQPRLTQRHRLIHHYRVRTLVYVGSV